MNFGIWQIIYLFWIALGLLVGANAHGKPRTGDHSFWITLTSHAIIFTIVYLGGFFK